MAEPGPELCYDYGYTLVTGAMGMASKKPRLNRLSQNPELAEGC